MPRSWPFSGTLPSPRSSSASARPTLISSNGWPWTCNTSKRPTPGSTCVTTASCRSCKAITGQDLGVEPENGRAGGPTSSAMPISRTFPRPSPRTPTLSIDRCIRRPTEPALRPAPPFRRSTARDRSSRFGSAIGSCRRERRPASSRFSPSWPSIAIGPPPTLRITIGGESIVATGIHRFWKAGKGWTMARELKAGDRFADGRRHGRDRIDRDRQDATRL